MVEKLKNDFKDWYIKAVKESNDFSNPEPILKFAGTVSFYGKDSLPFLRQIEQDLLDRKFINSKIECWDDFLNSRTKYPFARRIQYYIASIIAR